MSIEGKKILLGISGSIAAYKACDLIQRLKENGAIVRAILSPSAAKLVSKATLEALTGKPVGLDMWDSQSLQKMEHIEAARWADLYLIAPCTAHTLAELCTGLTGNLLSLIYSASQGPVFIAPAMNTVMLHSQAVQSNLKVLQNRSVTVLPSGEGVLACGEQGEGKLLDPNHIVAYLQSAMALRSQYPELKGKRILISLGHSHEKIDDVRYIANRSSGKTGFAIARAFHLCGASVTVVSGYCNVESSPGPLLHRVESSQDFHTVLMREWPASDCLIMAAAIADFIPSKTVEGKLNRSHTLLNLELQPSPDILGELGKNKKPGQIVVGFSLETSRSIEEAKAKLLEKKCDIAFINHPVATSSGFGMNTVKAGIYDLQQNQGQQNHVQPELTLQSKEAWADQLLALVLQSFEKMKQKQ